VDRRCVGHVEHLGVERLVISRDQVGDLRDAKFPNAIRPR
jgi:hypothetical protein